MNSGGEYATYPGDSQQAPSYLKPYEIATQMRNHNPTPEDLKNPHYILQNYRNSLSPLEHVEILNFKKIHYIPDLHHKLPALSNRDYQDNEGFYHVVLGDQIKYRYEILEEIGKGTYSQVLKVYDHKQNKYMAKKITRAGVEDIASTEVRILRYLREKGCGEHYIIELRKEFLFRGRICMVFDLLNGNLYDWIMRNGKLGFEQIKKVSVQILDALKFMKEHGVIHCDLKAENVLLEDDGGDGKIRIADFGLSCFSNEELQADVQSLWCRSPEVLVGMQYDAKIDMWSFGCILALLCSGNYIFRGYSIKEQIVEIEEILGAFQLEFQNGGYDIKRGGNLEPSVSLIMPLKCIDQAFLNFVGNCLEYDPKKRIDPEEALNHNWILQELTSCRATYKENTSMDSLIEVF